MEPVYDPKPVEARWQRTWEAEGLYEAHPESAAETYVIMHPPPNISGSLSIGHALQLALEDTLVRWHRMRGFDTLFQPGYDHGGISTWAAIGRELAKEGKTQRELGREGFDAYAEEWLERYGRTIMSQFRELGASLDYRRERFTMDPGYYRAVIRWFVHLYERGWIYRASRIVNWCPRDQTALSDVAVAVHPADERYRGLFGNEAIVPFVERHVPVVADDRVDPEFGTGALKVTPGHDPVDFEIGRDHDLPELTVVGLDGRMSEEAGDPAGLWRVRLHGAAPGRGRARHLVLVRALPVRDARLAGADARARALLPGRRAHDRARHHLPVGGPDDLRRARAPRRRPVLRRRHPLVPAQPRGPAHGSDARHGDRPGGGARAVRRRRDPLRPSLDDFEPGPALLVRLDRGGAEARDQALERLAPDPAERRRRAARRAPARARGP